MAAVFGPSQDGESENSGQLTGRCFASSGPFSLVRFFWASKEMNSRDSAKGFDLDFPIPKEKSKAFA
jgi:hypothetical protein